MNLTHLSEPTIARDLVQNWLDRIKERCSDGATIAGISTGFFDLDWLTDGLQKAQLVLIAGRPAMGKSAFCLNIIQHVTIKEKLPTAIFSLANSNEIIVQRLLVMGAEIDCNRIRTGHLKDEDWNKLSTAATTIHSAPLFLYDNQNSIENISACCRALSHSENGLRLVLLEDLQALQDCTDPTDNLKVGDELKALAVELDITIIATSQVSRTVEARRNKRPLLSDLECGVWDGRGSDVVLCIYRDEYYEPDCKTRGIAEIIIRKNRFGPLGTVDLQYEGRTSRFSDPTPSV